MTQRCAIRCAIFVAICVAIMALGVSVPLGFWTFAPILGLALLAVYVLPDSDPKES
jgi:hypothetical protein